VGKRVQLTAKGRRVADPHTKPREGIAPLLEVKNHGGERVESKGLGRAAGGLKFINRSKSRKNRVLKKRS